MNHVTSPQADFGIPMRGRPIAEVLNDLTAFKQGDPELENTLMSIGVNYGGNEIHDLLSTAHAQFAHENNMVVFARPGSKLMEDELLDFCARLLAGDTDGVVATISSGGTESIFNAVHAARERARELRPDIVRPKWVASYSAHAALTKACHFMDIELVRVPDREFRADVEAMAREVDERTIGLYASAPSFPFGLYDDVVALGELAQGHDIWLHVDACVGGFIAPFAAANGEPIPSWNFSVPGVTSISADIHKYGYGMKPASVTAWRNEDLLRYHHVVVEDWPMGTYVTPGFVGSRPGGPIAAAWSVMTHLGVDGYRDLTRQVFVIRDKLLQGLSQIPGIELPIPNPDLSIIVYRGTTAPINLILLGMEQRGWVHFSTHDPELIELVIDPTVGPQVDRYLADLADVVASAEAGEIEESQMTSTYSGEV